MHRLQPHAAILEAGGEIVTATPRQARWLQAVIGRAAAAAGRQVWATPRITPYGAWLAARARLLDARPQLLDPYVALRLWQMVITDSPAGAELMNVRATADEAARAWALAQDWRLPLERGGSPDELAFAGWARDFRARTEALGVLDSARLAALIAAQSSAEAATPVGFHGFAVRTPSRQSVCEALARGGRTVSELTLNIASAVPTPLAAASAEAECEAIAGWLADRLRQAPDARLIVLLPEVLLAPGAPDTRPYAFGLAPSLAAQPVVDAALGLLELGTEAVDVLAFGRLLRSPYLPGGSAGVAARARLDAALRAEGVRGLPLAELPRRLREMTPAEPVVATLIESVRSELDPARSRGPAEWADAFQRALRVAGWPKGRTLGSVEYEAARALTDALTSLAGLVTLLPELSFERARAELGSNRAAY
ncbi:MAG: hypothetical protein NTZ79_02555 [Proteobacteria bacterium]|nr:hypothetical protein [Pseudomonadota bacterium]